MARRETVSNEPVYMGAIAARKLGVTTQVLRVIEQQGLIRPFRTDTHQRVYSDVDLRKVEGAVSLRQMGLTYEEIRRVMGLVACHRIHQSCTEEKRRSCGHHLQMDRPCWAREPKCRTDYDRDACRECRVYTTVLGLPDFRHLMRAAQKR